MSEDKTVIVKYKGVIVGYLDYMKDIHKVSFRYDENWIVNGFSISPFSLPLRDELFIPSNDNFNGMFGVFADSLPDSWGILLLDKKLNREGKHFNEMNILDYLELIGNSCDKVLTYEPENNNHFDFNKEADFDKLAEQSLKLIEDKDIELLDELYFRNGNTGGARPKVNINIDDDLWIVKFRTRYDPKNIGKMEYDYFQCAEKCGIRVPEYRLIKTDNNEYFASKRFDKNKLVLTSAAILETDYRSPSLDYNSLIKLTDIISNSDKEEVMMMFRLMCFNVFAHNADDHAKNFSYIYNEHKDKWELSPAYDLTFSNTYYGEHTTSVDGNGYNPGREDILRVAKKNNLKNVDGIVDEIKEIVEENLIEYLS